MIPVTGRGRSFDELMAPKPDEIRALWAEMKPKLTPEYLASIAAYYPPAVQQEVLATLKLRVTMMEQVIKA